MRIAYVIGTYPTPSETFIAREIEGMRARGHEVTVYSLFAPDAGKAEGVTYGWVTSWDHCVRRAFRNRSREWLAARWQQSMREHGCQAVMGHFGSSPSTVAMLAAGDLPFFMSLHAHDIYVNGHKLAEKLARATATVTCTRANLEYLHQHFSDSADRIHLVYHGLPSHWMEAPIPERPRPAGAPLQMLAVGRFVPKKGYEVLLDACALLKQRGVSFTVRLIGDGRKREALEEQCRQLGLENEVAFPGWMPESQLRQEYADADVFCCPSVLTKEGDRDGLPNVLVEAMTTGLTAVGTNVSGIPEAIEHEVTGLLVPPGNAEQLADTLARCTDPALRARLGVKAAAVVRERFSFERGIDRLEELICGAK